MQPPRRQEVPGLFNVSRYLILREESAVVRTKRRWKTSMVISIQLIGNTLFEISWLLFVRSELGFRYSNSLNLILSRCFLHCYVLVYLYLLSPLLERSKTVVQISCKMKSFLSVLEQLRTYFNSSSYFDSSIQHTRLHTLHEWKKIAAPIRRSTRHVT